MTNPKQDQYVRLADVERVVGALSNELDRLICYAITTDEYEQNAAVANFRAAPQKDKSDE